MTEADRSTAVAPDSLADADDAARLRVWVRVQDGMIEERRKRHTRNRLFAAMIAGVGVLVLIASVVTGSLGLPPGAMGLAAAVAGGALVPAE